LLVEAGLVRRPARGRAGPVGSPTPPVRVVAQLERLTTLELTEQYPDRIGLAAVRAAARQGRVPDIAELAPVRSVRLPPPINTNITREPTNCATEASLIRLACGHSEWARWVMLHRGANTRGPRRSTIVARSIVAPRPTQPVRPDEGRRVRPPEFAARKLGASEQL